MLTPSRLALGRLHFQFEVNGKAVGDLKTQALVAPGESYQGYSFNPRFGCNLQRRQTAFA
jgi:hypothetical protein